MGVWVRLGMELIRKKPLDTVFSWEDDCMQFGKPTAIQFSFGL